ncbi:hypothetical protein Tco_1386437 [Tanacetum coccineum]
MFCPLTITSSRNNNNRESLTARKHQQPKPNKHLLKARDNVKHFTTTSLSPSFTLDDTVNLSPDQALGKVASPQANFMRIVIQPNATSSSSEGFGENSMTSSSFSKDVGEDSMTSSSSSSLSSEASILNRRQKAKTSQPWTTTEEIMLCKAWCSVTENYVTRDAIKRGFWSEVVAYFEKEMGENIR